MATEKIVIEYDQKDILGLICEKHGLDKGTANISISYTPDTQREPEYLQIFVKSNRK
jgi:hypothetical protein